jgi:hypothetical protein
MTDQQQPAPPAEAAPTKPGMKRRWMVAIVVLTFLFVIMPFLFWRATWFGNPLNSDEIQKALADPAHPREIQHALSQIADRIMSPDEATRASARQFYPAVTQIAESPSPELRLTAAWVMGQDNTAPEFHRQLSALLHDPNPMVRRNAALGLVRFDDPAGLDEIRSLLAPYAMPAPFSGLLLPRLRAQDSVNPGTLLGHIQTVAEDLPGKGSKDLPGEGSKDLPGEGSKDLPGEGSKDLPGEGSKEGQEMELRADVPGQINRWLIPDGAPVTKGQPILLIDPSPAEVYEALRALYLMGQPQDLSAVDQFIHGGPGVPDNVRQQAQNTDEAIRARQKTAAK